MTITLPPDNLAFAWARLGVAFNSPPAKHTPDVERLLLETAVELGENARLFPLIVTWLYQYGEFVARHRLRRLLIAELPAVHQPAIGLLLDSAIHHGAAAELAIVCDACSPALEPAPLFRSHRSSPELRDLAARTASDLSRRWGLHAPEVQLKPDAIRPVAWLLGQNPSLRSRIIRRGDLRASILETLRIDFKGWVRSESELARLTGATRPAVRHALRSLILEGEVTIGTHPENHRDHPVSLTSAA